MIIEYTLLVASITGVTILWRTFKNDHPRFKTFVRNLPLVGESLSCGVCVSFWFSLPPVLYIHSLQELSAAPLSVIAAWLSVSTGVLLLRSAIIVLLEGAAVLSHKHITSHH